MGFEGLISRSNSGTGNCSGGGCRIVADISSHNNYMPSGSIVESPRHSQPISNSMQNSPAFSFSTQRKMEGRNEIGTIAGNLDNSLMGRMRDDGDESRSGSDNFEGLSGDDQYASDDQPQRKKRNRHAPQQIQELESFFKDFPHPDEKQRLELSRRLGLTTKQVKFWFQNRRTQLKTQLERYENEMLRQENEKLKVENSLMKEAISHPVCPSCGGPAIPGQISFDEHQIRIENARLKDELNSINVLANKFFGKPLSSLPSPMALPTSNSCLELAIGMNGISGPISTVGTPLTMGLDLGGQVLGTQSAMPGIQSPMGLMGNDVQHEISMLIDLASSAMEELIKMAQADTPLWVKSLNGEKELLNLEEYERMFSPCTGPKPTGYVTEATRETGLVIINSSALVETLMDMNQWVEMFSSMIARAVTFDVITNGVGETRNGALQVMHAEVQLLSPLVPVRSWRFLRFCKQHAEGLWSVVDVSVDTGRDAIGTNLSMSCRRLPSGCVVQDMPNGYSKVIWVEHSQYDESVVHQLYRPLLNSGLGFGAQRWIATLQRQCECLAILMSSANPLENHTVLSQAGRRSMLKLARRMTSNFCSGVCASSARKWDSLHIGTLGDDIKVMTRKNLDDPGEPPGIVVSAATSVWMPVSSQRLFDFLRNERMRSEWDILSSGGPMQEMVNIAKGQGQGNCVSLLRASDVNANDNSMLILQETWTDMLCSAVVYAPVDRQSINVVMGGGDSAYVALLPSGFAILPDGGAGVGVGSLLTVGFQILVNNLPTAKLTVESVDTVNNLISCTIQKIKNALEVA